MSIRICLSRYGGIRGRNFASMEIDLDFKDKRHGVTGRIVLSPEQAVEVIRVLWAQLDPEDRPCP